VTVKRIGVAEDGSERIYVEGRDVDIVIRDEGYEAISIDREDLDALIEALRTMKSEFP